MADPNPTESLVAARRRRSPGAVCECPKCGAQFGGMTECPFDGTTLVPLADADPTALAFYEAIGAA